MKSHDYHHHHNHHQVHHHYLQHHHQDDDHGGSIKQGVEVWELMQAQLLAKSIAGTLR